MSAHLALRISQAERSSTIVVFSEAQRKEAERIIRSTRPFDGITVKAEPPEEYDGRGS